MIKKLKTLCGGHMLSVMLEAKKLLQKTFYKKKFQKTNQKGFRVEKEITRKGDKLYVKWEGYNNLINGWIDKKDMI